MKAIYILADALKTFSENDLNQFSKFLVSPFVLKPKYHNRQIRRLFDDFFVKSGIYLTWNRRLQPMAKLHCPNSPHLAEFRSAGQVFT